MKAEQVILPLFELFSVEVHVPSLKCFVETGHGKTNRYSANEMGSPFKGIASFKIFLWGLEFQ